MGTWSATIFGDDTARDVRDDFKASLAEHGSAQAATDALLARWKESLDDPDEGPVIWIALALTQHKLGLLDERVRREALRVFDAREGLNRWEAAGPALLKKRLAALESARQLLLSPQPAPARIRPAFRDSCSWEAGELIAYRLTSKRWTTMRVIAHESHAHGIGPVIELLDWTGSEPPQPGALAHAAARSETLKPWTLFQLLRHSQAQAADDAALATSRVLAQLGLIDAAAAAIRLLDPPPGFNMAAHTRKLEKALDELRRESPAIRKRLEELARTLNPKLLAPVAQISLRREPELPTLPARRLKRLRITQPTPRAEDWIAVRWSDLDEFLKDVFGLE